MVPHLGRVKLTDLDAGHLGKMYGDLLTSGRRPVKEGGPSVVTETAVRLKGDGLTCQQVPDHLNAAHGDHGPSTRHSVAAIVRRHNEAHSPANRDEGLSPRTVGQVHTIVKRALKDAVRWGRLARDPADAVDPPRQSMRPELPVISRSHRRPETRTRRGSEIVSVHETAPTRLPERSTRLLRATLRPPRLTDSGTQSPDARTQASQA